MSMGIWHPAGFMDPTRNPKLGRVAGRAQQLIMGLFRRPAAPGELDRWHAVEDVLRYAAEAEQRVAELNRQIKRLEELSEQDQLTGIANRRGLEKFLDSMLSSALRYDERGVLIFADLDNFKRINDTHGHEAGDRVLKGAAVILRQHTRRSDFVARLGGDEFVIILPRTNPSVAGLLANKLQDALEETVFTCGDIGLSVRASFGVVPYSPKSTRNDLLDRADRAMYAQKRSRATLQKLFGAAQ